MIMSYNNLHYIIVMSQMGSSMRREIFTERVSRDLKNWHKRAKQSVSKNNSTSSKHSDTLHSKECDNSVRGSVDIVHTSDNVVLTSPPSHMISGEEEKSIAPTNEQEISSNSTSEIIKTTQEENPKIITRGTYDGEISFGSSWKNVGSSRGIGEIGSIIEEDDAEKLPELIP